MPYRFTLLFFVVLLLFYSCGSSTTDASNNSTRPKVSIKTSYGEMIIELFNETPLHRDNFLKLAKAGFYDSLMFHRVQPFFMIQGGDPDSKGHVEPNQLLGMDNAEDRIPAEINPNFIMRQGALCGFHSGVGLHPDKSSHPSQFMLIHGQILKAYQLQDVSIKNQMDYTKEQIDLYEMHGGSPQLDGSYTIFGQIIQGIHVLDKIVNAKTYRSIKANLPDRPVDDIRMVVKVIE